MTFKTQWSQKKESKGIDLGEPTIEIKGAKIKVRDWINENNTDCEIYETLEKYGIINVRKMNDEELKAIASEIGNMNLMEAMDRLKEGEKIWKDLPLEMRKEFNNDVEEFIKNGEKWVKEKITAREKAEEEFIKKSKEEKKKENKKEDVKEEK